MSRHLGKVFPVLSLLLTLFGSPQGVYSSTAGSPPNFSYDLQAHHLSVLIDPSQHGIKGRDQLDIQLRGKKTPISLLLNSRLKVNEIVTSKTAKPLPWIEASFSDTVKRIDISVPNRPGFLSLSISYEGSIYDPVIKEKSLQFVKGDQTAGLIAPEGVYLSSNSHWYPDKPDSISLFEAEVTLPAPFRAVTQGELVSEDLKGGFWKSKWSSNLPAESLTLVAGKYSVKTRNVNGTRIST